LENHKNKKIFTFIIIEKHHRKTTAAINISAGINVYCLKNANDLLGWDVEVFRAIPGAIAPSFGSCRQITAYANYHT
jgi:hypothetical protein